MLPFIYFTEKAAKKEVLNSYSEFKLFLFFGQEMKNEIGRVNRFQKGRC